MSLGALPDHTRVLIVGAGFGGLGLAIRLQQQGELDFLVVEKGDDVGGTWRDNTYPGAACDVPSQLYSFSFALNPHWSRSFSPQPEIQAYLRRVAGDAGVLDRFRFGTALVGARWDTDARVWRADTAAGPITADVLVTASGGLSEPSWPDIDGLEDFHGDVFHTARWDHSVDLTGKRVAIIGTGASAIQVVPEMAKVAGRLDVYQRTAPWVIPRRDRAYSAVERFAYRHLPGLQRLHRAAIYLAREMLVPAFTWKPALAAPAKRAALANLHKAVSDPGLRESLTPRFEIGCKRILLSDDYYPALARDHVEVVTDPISKVSGHAVVTAGGVERAVDAIIVATGFATTEQPIAEHVTGQHGRTLAAVWADDGMAAYKGTTVHGFPNLFQIVGPNTGLGHSSMVFVIECQIGYILDALRLMESEGLATVQPRADVQQHWNADLQRRMSRTVWSTGGCSSWYLDDHGRNTTLWPRSTITLKRLLSRFDAEHYLTQEVGR